MNSSSIHPKIYGVLDIGTSAIRAVIATPFEHSWNILGWGAYPSSGMKKGNIVDFERLYQATQCTWDQALLHSGIDQFHKVAINISTSGLSHAAGLYEVPLHQRKAQAADLKKARALMEQAHENDGQKVLHALTQSFSIDGKEFSSPVGHSGQILQWNVLSILCQQEPLEDRVKLLSRLGLACNCPIVDSLASAQAVLSEKERLEGVLQIDLGAGSTKWSVYKSDIVSSVDMIPIGGDQLTADIALALKTSLATAEVLKVRHGAIAQKVSYSDLLQPPMGEKGIILDQQTLYYLNQVITMRLEEMFSIIEGTLKKSESLGLIDSVVLSGGLSQIPGLSILAEQIFGVPVRIGAPIGLKEQHPFFHSSSAATLMGLLGVAREKDLFYEDYNKSKWTQWFKKVQNWIVK